MVLGAIEAGGTKFVCSVGNDKGEIFNKVIFPTTTPTETMDKVISFFKQHEIEGIGIGCFGPMDLNEDSETYGYITSTPKILWQNYDILGTLKREFSIPINIDTDVNAAALGEATWGAAKHLDNSIYITVGTGIGVGVITDGKIYHGLTHPEMGHVLVQRHQDDDFQGACVFHPSCLESLASGNAIDKRWGMSGKEIPLNHKAWEFEAYYLAQAIVTYILTLSPKKVIMGGGVLKQQHLFPMVRNQVIKMLNGYIQINDIINDIDNYIVYPKLGDHAGICGALALAKKSKTKQRDMIFRSHIYAEGLERK